MCLGTHREALRHPNQLLPDAILLVELTKLVYGAMAVWLATLEQCHPLHEGLSRPYLQGPSGH